MASSVVLLAGIAAVGVYERESWLRQVRAQCQAAAPLVQQHAPRQTILNVLGAEAGEYDPAQAAWLIAQFGASSPKGRDLAASLTGSSRVLVYSQSNSVMFVYLDAQLRATRAQCFLQ